MQRYQRYIDAELAKQALTGWETDPTDEEIILAIDRIPTADVVPRAEVEALKDEADRYKRYYFRHDYDEMIAEAKAEVAREIFKKIEGEITDALKSNYEVLPQVEESEALWNNVNGKISALSGIRYFIDELKKKYTEESSNE